MKANQVVVDQLYKASSSLLTQPFVGKVIKKGEHSAILSVESSSPEDSLRVNDLGKVIVVAYSDLLDKAG